MFCHSQKCKENNKHSKLTRVSSWLFLLLLCCHTRYCKCNPKVFSKPDVAFILSYSIIMLNTDAHNPNIKPEKKMTKSDFVSNNRGIDDGQNVPKELLGRIYDSITT